MCAMETGNQRVKDEETMLCSRCQVVQVRKNFQMSHGRLTLYKTCKTCRKECQPKSSDEQRQRAKNRYWQNRGQELRRAKIKRAEESAWRKMFGEDPFAPQKRRRVIYQY